RRLHPFGRALGHPLLVERVTTVVGPGGKLRPLEHARRPSLQRRRTRTDRTQQAGTHGQDVPHDVELGDVQLGEVDLGGIGDTDGPLTDLDLLVRSGHERNATRSLARPATTSTYGDERAGWATASSPTRLLARPR